MADKKARREIRLTEEDWRRLDWIAETMGDMSSSSAVRFLIRRGFVQSKESAPVNVSQGQSERLILRVAENDKKTLDLIAKSLGGVSRSTVMRHLIRQWAAQQKESSRIKSS